MPRAPKPKRPNLIKIADAAATLLKAPGGGWTWQTAVDDAAGNAGLLDSERAELDRLLEARGCPRPDPGETDGAPATPEVDPWDDDAGPFYDRAEPVASVHDNARPAPAEDPPDMPEPLDPRNDMGDWDESERLLAEADREITLDGPDQHVAGGAPMDPEGDCEPAEPPDPKRRTTRELLAEAEDTARRLRVRLLNEGARERLDNGRPLPSEAMRCLEALHPLRKTLRPAVFDQVMGTIVAEIELDWGPIVT